MLLLERGAPVDAPANPPETGPPLGWAIHGSTNCRNPDADYAAIVEAIIQSGGKPASHQLKMASAEVAVVLQRYPEKQSSQNQAQKTIQ